MNADTKSCWDPDAYVRISASGQEPGEKQVVALTLVRSFKS